MLPVALIAHILVPPMSMPLPDRVIASFFDPGEPARWVTINDNVMGGRSTGGPSFADGLLTFSGRTNTDGGGFSSVRTRERAWGLADSEGLLLRVRGDGRTYIAAVTTDQRVGWGPVNYWQEFTTTEGEWLTVSLPFEGFTPTTRGMDLTGRVPGLDPARAETIGLYIYDKQDGPFRLDVAWIGSYTAGSADEASAPTTASDGTGSPRRALDALELAIARGVPRFNRGDHSGCADIYEVALMMLLAGSDEVPGPARDAAERGLREGAAARTQSERAWAYRRAIDDAARSLVAGADRSAHHEGGDLRHH